MEEEIFVEAARWSQLIPTAGSRINWEKGAGYALTLP